jgi:hypothetical protein
MSVATIPVKSSTIILRTWPFEFSQFALKGTRSLTVNSGYST